ncbi:MAG: N-acetyltransferase [Chlamydiota bacterium]
MKRLFYLGLIFFSSTIFSEEMVSVKYPSAYFDQVDICFHKVLDPLYGDQTIALEKIAKGTDRVCEVLVSQDNKLLGILVYKNYPTQEYVNNALEIKTFFIVDSKQNSGKGLGTQLLNRVFFVVKENPAFQNIVVTVSEEKPEVCAFFVKKGFHVYKTMSDKYKKGIHEYIFCKSVEQ